MKGRVLVIAGSDSGGGAGIQADIKTVTALGGYAATAITALTAQNTEGVFGIHEVPEDFIALQIRLVLRDIGADCIKIGMLHRPEVIEVVARTLEEEAAGLPIVVDPVMVAKGGASLLEEQAVDSLKRRMLPLAAVLTPNLPEAAALAGFEIRGESDAKHAAAVLASLGCPAVLMKGGHMEGVVLKDLLFEDGRMIECFEQPRIKTVHTHGTGCTTASAIAAGLAQGMPLRDAVARALAYVRQAILSAPGFGHGHGPLDHAHTVAPFSVR